MMQSLQSPILRFVLVLPVIAAGLPAGAQEFKRRERVEYRAVERPLTIKEVQAKNFEVTQQGEHETDYQFKVLPLNQLQRQRLGITTAVADATLRAQLELADGKGLVVAHLEEDGPAEQAGILLHDILLSANDTSLQSVDNLDNVIKTAPKESILFQVMRGGQAIPLQLKMADPVDAGDFEDVHQEIRLDAYRIGVEVVPGSSTLRAQLRLPTDQGIVVKRLVPKDGSPAHEAGIKEHDVLISAGKRVLGSPNDLRSVVELSEGKAITITLLRRGNRETVTVTPKKENALASGLLKLSVIPAKTSSLPIRVRYEPVTVKRLQLVFADSVAEKRPESKLKTILQQLEKSTAAVKQLIEELESPDASAEADAEGAAQTDK